MELDTLLIQIDNMIASMLSLDGRVIDVMSAGKFLNELDGIVRAPKP